MKKLTSILIALAMMVVLAVPAFAATVNTSTEAGVGVKAPATKTIDKATGTSTPVETYTIKVSNTTLGDKTFDTDAQNLEIEDVLSQYTFTDAGRYEFTVTEKAPVADPTNNITVEGYTATKTTEDEDSKTVQTTVYSQAEYKVTALVASNTTETGTTYYVQSVQVQKMKNDDGSNASGDKVDLHDENGKTQFAFVNKVNEELTNKKPGETTKDEDKDYLEISKTTAYKDGLDDAKKTGIPDQEFTFKATVKFPANSVATAYTAKIKDASGYVTGKDDVVFTKPQTPDEDGNYKATKTFTLKNGQWLSFVNVETGAEVTELTEDTYPGFAATGIPTEEVEVSSEGNNAIDVTNKYDPDEGSLTGILMSNIPYIVLALVALGGLCAYVVVRRKNADEA